MHHPPRALLGAILAINGLAVVGGVLLTQHSLFFALMPLALYVAVAVAGFGLALLSGARWAAAVLLVVMLLVLVVNLRGDVETVERQQFDLVSAAKLGLYVVAFGYGLLLLTRSYPSLLEMPTVLIVGYLALGLVTAPFSLTPDYTLGMAFALAAWLLFGAALTLQFDTGRLLQMIIAACGIFCVGSLVAYFAVPEYGRFISPEVNVMRLTGLSSTPNEAGQVGALLLIAVLSYQLTGYAREGGARWRLLLPFLVLPALAVMAMAGGRGAIASFAVTAVAMLLQKLRLGRLAIGLGLLALMVTAIVALASPRVGEIAERQAASIARSGDASEVASLAGRANVWRFAIQRIGEQPVLGYGLGASSRLIQQNYETRWGERPGSAHNAFLQSTLDLGLVGVSLLVGVFLWSLWRFLVDPWPFRDGMFVFVLLTCLLESGISKPVSALALIWIVSLMSRPPSHALPILSRRSVHHA